MGLGFGNASSKEATAATQREKTYQTGEGRVVSRETTKVSVQICENQREEVLQISEPTTNGQGNNCFYLKTDRQIFVLQVTEVIFMSTRMSILDFPTISCLPLGFGRDSRLGTKTGPSPVTIPLKVLPVMEYYSVTTRGKSCHLQHPG